MENAMGILGRATAALAIGLAAAAAQAQTVEIRTSMGTITAELYPDRAPKTVDNFVQYVKAGFYNGTIFHRVIPTFMIQGGGFTPDMQQKKTRAPIAHEGREAVAKGARNETGTLAMARTSDPHSATAQFFINVQDNEFLNPVALPDGDPVTFQYQGRMVNWPRAQAIAATAGYTVFGKVVKGMDVVEKIKVVRTGSAGMHQDVPATPVIIESVKLVDAPRK
ncbi:MAG: peptidyl-prolyl cis-trans isomerase [Burkholderiales bacterium]|nr:peptidyl-prolyl cis-trans isomerase [Burkholderiales bacterium]